MKETKEGLFFTIKEMFINNCWLTSVSFCFSLKVWRGFNQFNERFLSEKFFDAVIIGRIVWQNYHQRSIGILSGRSFGFAFFGVSIWKSAFRSCYFTPIILWFAGILSEICFVENFFVAFPWKKQRTQSRHGNSRLTPNNNASTHSMIPVRCLIYHFGSYWGCSLRAHMVKVVWVGWLKAIPNLLETRVKVLIWLMKCITQGKKNNDYIDLNYPTVYLEKVFNLELSVYRIRAKTVCNGIGKQLLKNRYPNVFWK